MKEIYKGYEIEYLEQIGKFNAKIGQSSYDNESLSAVKKYIDNLEKKDFKRVDVIINDYTGYEYGTITSCVKSRHYGGHEGIDCWISLKNGSRKKMDIKSVYLDNEKNREILDDIIKKEQEIKGIKQEIKNLHLSFEKYTYEINLSEEPE